jgi:hypothetical protein
MISLDYDIVVHIVVHVTYDIVGTVVCYAQAAGQMTQNDTDDGSSLIIQIDGFGIVTRNQNMR